MTDELRRLYLGRTAQPIAEGDPCGAPNNEVFFIAPIDLLPGDQIVIDPRSGQPLGIYREKKLVWEFEGEYYTGSFSGTFTGDHDLLAKLLGGAAHAN